MRLAALDEQPDRGLAADSVLQHQPSGILSLPPTFISSPLFVSKASQQNPLVSVFFQQPLAANPAPLIHLYLNDYGAL